MIPTQLVLVSIGYKSLPVPGLPFDSRRGLVPNSLGRVLKPKAGGGGGGGTEGGGGEFEEGLYVCGWLKRGPTGIIGTNLNDAEETVASLVQDAQAGRLPQGRGEGAGGRGALGGVLGGRGVRAVSFEDWLRLDAMEVEAGAREGRPRVKGTDVAVMLKALDS